MPYKVVEDFERKIAEFAGAPYAVAVESGTAAIFLSLMWRAFNTEIGRVDEVKIPAFTYPSVPCSIIHAGGRPVFHGGHWEGVYELEPLRIIDAALRFKEGMYHPGTLYCLSFHVKKHLPIGRGGMILTDDERAAAWLKKARFDGRDACDLNTPQEFTLGWNMYLTPEQAARGLLLFQMAKNWETPDLRVEDQGYPDLSKVGAYRV